METFSEAGGPASNPRCLSAATATAYTFANRGSQPRSKDEMNTVSVVIPVYNEAQTISNLLDRVLMAT